LYCDVSKETPSDTSREMACPDMLVIDTADKVVEFIIEFELDTNPKNLIGNAFAPMLARTYRDPRDKRVYRLDPARTKVVLLACVERARADMGRDLAPVQKGYHVASRIEEAAKVLLQGVQPRTVQTIYALAHDDWELMLRDLEIIFQEVLAARAQPDAGTPTGVQAVCEGQGEQRQEHQGDSQ
jgi:hypothetical protein